MAVAQPLTPGFVQQFCAVLAETGVVARAIEATGANRWRVYQWRKDDPGFCALWDASLEVGLTALEDEVKRRAFEGVEKPVVYQGQLTPVWERGEDGEVLKDDQDRAVQARNPDGSLKWLTVREYSDSLAMFILKGRIPAYRDKQDLNVSGSLSIAEVLAKARKRAAPPAPEDQV